MENITVKSRIIDVLVENRNRWLNAEEIAELAYNGAFIKDTQKGLTDKIRRNINQAVTDMLNNQNLIVITRSEESARKGKPRRNKEYRPIISYKIAGDDDQVFIGNKYLNDRDNRLRAYVEKRNTIVQGLSEKGVLPTGVKMQLKLEM